MVGGCPSPVNPHSRRLSTPKQHYIHHTPPPPSSLWPVAQSSPSNHLLPTIYVPGDFFSPSSLLRPRIRLAPPQPPSKRLRTNYNTGQQPGRSPPMVQYVLTPWWDRNELLLVRDQFYAASSDISSRPSPARRYASHPEGSEVSNKDHHARSQPSQSADGDGDTTDQQRQAVARVSMWMQRGNCPHLVEATALLTAAVLSDHLGSADAGGSYAVRAAYSAAFSRYVGFFCMCFILTRMMLFFLRLCFLDPLSVPSMVVHLVLLHLGGVALRRAVT